MAEWLKAHAWKACIPQGIQGSNPCLSAIPLLTERGCGRAGWVGRYEKIAELVGNLFPCKQVTERILLAQITGAML